MKRTHHARDARPCWKCQATTAEYIVDNMLSLVRVRCTHCDARDLFAVHDPLLIASASDASAAHRGKEHADT
jgi:hypothetical protein